MAMADQEKLSKLSEKQLSILKKGDLQEILNDTEILNCITGRLGPYVIRHQNGKSIVSRRAENFKASQSDKAVYFRHKFASAQRFASFINSIAILARVWDEPMIPRYNKMIKQNVVNCDEFWPTIKNVITPNEFHFKIEEAKITKGFLSLKLNDRYSFNDSDILKVILMVYDPVNRDDKKYELLEVNPAYSLFGTAVNLTDEQLLVCMKYRKSIHYIAVIKNDGDELRWSNTFAIEGFL